MAADRSPRFRFGIQTLLATTTIACLMLGMFVREAARYNARKRSARAQIEMVGGRIEEIGTTGNPSPGHNWLTEFFGLTERNEQLWEVDCSGTELTGEQLETLRGCDWVRFLDLSGTHIKDADLEIVSTLAKLRKLGLNETEVSNEGLSHLHENQRLIELRTAGTRITYEGLTKLDTAFEDYRAFAELSLVPFLEANGVRVTLASVHVPSDQDDIRVRGLFYKYPRSINLNDASKLSQKTLDTIRKLRSVRSLDGSSTQDRFNLQGIFRDLIELRAISITGGSPSDDDIRDMSRLPHLRYLDLFSPHLISDDAIRELKNAKQLESLTLAGIFGSLHRAPLLTECKNLRKLRLSAIRQGRPKRLTDEQLRATIGYLQSLKTLPHLMSLRFSGSDIQDEVVMSFVEHSNLKQLVLLGKSKFLSDETLDQFRAARPDVEVRLNGVSDDINLD